MVTVNGLCLLLLVFIGAVFETDATWRWRRWSKKTVSVKTPSPSLQPTEDTGDDCVFGEFYDVDNGPYNDVETIWNIEHVTGDDICDGDTPLDIECLTVDGEIPFDETGLDRSDYWQLYCLPQYGFKCQRTWTGPQCPDFKVSFCCPNGQSDGNGGSGTGSGSKSGSKSGSGNKSGGKSGSKD